VNAIHKAAIFILLYVMDAALESLERRGEDFGYDGRKEY